MAGGERIIAGAVGLFGVLWIWQSSRLNYWAEFAPGAGFLPFWLGVALVALAAVFLVDSFRNPVRPAADASPVPPLLRGKVPAIALGLVVCIGALEWVGFTAAIALYLAFLIGVVERRPAVETLTVPVIAALALWLVFSRWLSVPLPKGPWGF